MSWPLVKLGDVAPAKASKHAFSTSDEVWTLNLDQVEADTGNVLGKVMAPVSEAGTSTHGFDERHVLYSKLRPYLNKVVLPDEKGLATTELVPMLPDPLRLDRKYLAYYLRSKSFVDWVSSQVAGAKMPRVSMQLFWQHEIPLPPLPEQKRIAAILDKADAIRRKRQQAIQLADDFLRAVFLDMFGDPVTNPKGWVVKKVKDLCMVRGGKRIPKGDSLVKENTGFPYIKAGNIKSGQVTTKNLEYVPSHVRKVIERYTVDEGDVCITVVGANIGDVGVVPKELHKASLTENANKIIIRDSAVLSSGYLSFFLQTDFVQSQIKSKIMAVGVPKLAIFRIEELDLILPPKELQDKFSHVVSAVDGLGESLERSNSLSKLEFQCLNQKAFRGEL
ncbi:hypothetical protein PS893_04011 [Pseudomonas fluorescens]|uniref:restriction endonuclease subunit S n=1 Tax=Pseudomonas fluorescens TaxID=294 RepID=UPI00125B9042|nr:restriction endonuclease subunit S [Pseudomonas fluorescens]VVP24611.1 hypothetical protein PS893_04011 [Pseudomonas fluorescens]